MKHDPSNPEKRELIELFGGPYDGAVLMVAKEQAHSVVNGADVYTYCPHATKRLGKLTFTHQHIAHDALAD